MSPDLPRAITDVQIGDWETLPPQDLILKPGLLSEELPSTVAARALRYSRVGPSDSYDEIGFRFFAAEPHRYKDSGVLQTIPGMKLQRQWSEANQMDPKIETLLSEQAKLRHRPIDLPDGGDFSWSVEGKLMHFSRRRYDTREVEEVWTFPLSAPPKKILQTAEPRDEPPIVAQHYHFETPGANWISLSQLIESGRFHRMQEWRERLEPQTAPKRFYCFVSHRWLSPTHPDPEGVQATFVAWQIFSHLCESIRIARARGLHEPRKISSVFGFPVGINGSSLAEALLVNLLRDTLDQELLEKTWEEVALLEEVTTDYGIAAAKQDAGLHRLRHLIANLPLLATLLESIFLWYDYSCMPQPPRTGEDEKLFRDGLEHLMLMQIVGRTVILLDEAEDYLSRGWCLLEALIGDTELNSIDLLPGTSRRPMADRLTEHYFTSLMQDRPHILWRAIIDTEVFRVQTRDQCMARLNLGFTESRDAPFIYRKFLNLRAPVKIHLADSELVTGVFPLPVVEGPEVLAPRGTGRVPRTKSAPQNRSTLDWTAAVRLNTAWNEDNYADSVASFITRATVLKDKPSCHVAVVASCEGEAVLLSNWIWNRLSELEDAIDSHVSSLSWLATDIAPVGHFLDGTLHAVPIRADVWVVVATNMRFAHCEVTGQILETLAEANLQHFELAVDVPENNLRAVTPFGDPDPVEAVQHQSRSFERLDPALLPFPVHGGGLFRKDLLEYLTDSREDLS